MLSLTHSLQSPTGLLCHIFIQSCKCGFCSFCFLLTYFHAYSLELFSKKISWIRWLVSKGNVVLHWRGVEMNVWFVVSILEDPGAARWDEGIFVGESLLQQGDEPLGTYSYRTSSRSI